MVKDPLKVASATPEMKTIWPATKLCAAVVVMVTTLEERYAPLVLAIVAVTAGGSAAGAVKSPAVVIVPTVALPPSTSLTNHFTELLMAEPPLDVASAAVWVYVNVVEVGTEAIVKVPLKLVLETPVIETNCPLAKPWAAEVVIVTTLFARTAVAIVTPWAPVTDAENDCVALTINVATL
jgi:hypothetical protein